MAQNPIQFQNGLSLPDFLKDYGSEDQCEQALEQWRWPQGFICPSCGHQREPVRLRTRALLQCRHCHHQASLTAGTLFAATKLPLTTWFLAMFLLTQQKNGISALELKRHLGVAYLTAWRVKHKLLQVMKERDDQTPLGGVIEVDDAYWGGDRHGAKPGRGSPNKVAFIAALSCNDAGHPIGLRLGKVAGFRKTEVERFAKRHFDPNAIVLTDGLACFTGIASAGFEHQPVVTVAAIAAWPSRSSSGSTPSSATSKTACMVPTISSAPSIYRATWGSSAIASIAALTWPPCCRAWAGRRCVHRQCRIAS